MSDLTGKVAVVLGASGKHSFGVAIAKLFAARGAKVVVSARRKEPLEKLAAEIGGTAIACDITEEDQLEALAKGAVEAYGRLDIAVNSAGILAGAPISTLTKDMIMPTLEVSFAGALLFFKYMAAEMKEGGSIMTISSLTARLPGLGISVYSGARAGIDYALRVAALEYGPQQIRFNSIAAGLVKTDLNDFMFENPELEKGHIAATPLGRIGVVEDIANTALWLASDESAFITGQVIDVAGGQQNGRLSNQDPMEA